MKSLFLIPYAFFCIVFIFLVLAAHSAMAVGTLAGTNITNKATATYSVGTISGLKENSNVYTIRVDELVDVDVTWQDVSEVIVTPGSSNSVLTFLLTNTGNGSETFGLSGNSTLATDDFDPILIDLYLDLNGNGVYDPGVDGRYLQGVNDPALAADANITVFILSDIPLDPNDSDRGDSQLTARSLTGEGDPGTTFAGAGERGTDAVIGISGGSDNETGTYLVSSVDVSIVKSAHVADPFGGNRPVPGAVITYTIVVAASGNGTAENLIIEDHIPDNTTYVGGSLLLNTGFLTDIKDSDAGDVGETKSDTVTVYLGDLTPFSPAQTITFRVKID